MNKARLKDLLVANRDAIKMNLDGSDGREATLNKLKKIVNEYKSLAGEFRSEDEKGFIRGVLHSHNSENFSKLTTLLIYEDDLLNISDFYGDESLVDGMKEIICNEVDLKADSKLIEIKISEKEDLSYVLYCSVIVIRGRSVVIASISSSHYFDIKRFLFISGIIKNLYDRDNLLKHTYSIDYFSRMLDEIDETVKEFIHSGRSAEGHFYVFKSIEEIFKHSSITTYSDISGIITGVFKNYYGSNSRIFMASLKCFLIIAAKDGNSDEETGEKSKVSIIYNELPLPYETVKFDLSEYSSIYSLWDKISLFYNYVSGGDLES